MPGYSVDGNDVLAVRATTLKAVAEARKGEGPSMIENKTYRIRGHFEGDPQKYRDQAEVLTWQEKNDPIKRFEAHLVKAQMLTKKKSKADMGRGENRTGRGPRVCQEQPVSKTGRCVAGPLCQRLTP